ncbi:MAG: hypothetical protein K2K85_00975 [Clostridia bacterium]|nr:hypothetical protein [Clostridia bacterium]
MKNIKRIFIAIFLIGVLSMSTILCACNTDDTPPCDLVLTQFYLKDQNPYMSNYFDDETKLNLAEKITSVEELKSFCQDKQLKVFDETDTTLKSDRVSNKLKEYDETFFKSHAIVLIFRFNETSDFYTYDSTDIKDGVMTIKLVTANGNATTNIRTHIRIFEISKKAAKKINQIQVEERIGELDQRVGIKIYQDFINIKASAPSSIINSTEELDLFKNFDTYESNSIKTIENFIATLEKYDDDYFQNKSLILIFQGYTSARFYKVKSFDIKDANLNIILSTPELNGYEIPWPILVCAYIFEIDKNQSADINNIIVEKIEE